MGLIFGAAAVKGELFGQLNGLVGSDTALGIQKMIASIKLSDDSIFATVIGAIVLLVGASGVFSEIQSSINYIWGIEAKPKRGLVKFLKNRLMSFSMIGSVGFLFTVGLITNTVMEIISKGLANRFPEVTLYLFHVINLLIVFLITVLLFTLVFKTLPDGKVSTKDGVIGAFFTTLLFMLGKFLIAAYLSNSHIVSIYGAAGSVIIILLWVYYSAIILYFGAEFTKVYAHTHGEKIIPNAYSVKIRETCSDPMPPYPQ